MNRSPDDRPPIVVALEWTTRLTTIALEMALPGAGGFWLDQWLGTKALFLVLGVIVGFVLGMWHLVLLTRPPKSKD